jgi:hypothetical protein
VQSVAKQAQRAAVTEAKQEAKKQDLPVDKVTGERESDEKTPASNNKNPAL